MIKKKKKKKKLLCIYISIFGLFIIRNIEKSRKTDSVQTVLVEIIGDIGFNGGEALRHFRAGALGEVLADKSVIVLESLEDVNVAGFRKKMVAAELPMECVPSGEGELVGL